MFYKPARTLRDLVLGRRSRKFIDWEDLQQKDEYCMRVMCARTQGTLSTAAPSLWRSS